MFIYCTHWTGHPQDSSIINCTNFIDACRWTRAYPSIRVIWISHKKMPKTITISISSSETYPPFVRTEQEMAWIRKNAIPLPWTELKNSIDAYCELDKCISSIRYDRLHIKVQREVLQASHMTGTSRTETSISKIVEKLEIEQCNIKNKLENALAKIAKETISL